MDANAAKRDAEGGIPDISAAEQPDVAGGKSRHKAPRVSASPEQLCRDGSSVMARVAAA